MNAKPMNTKAAPMCPNSSALSNRILSPRARSALAVALVLFFGVTQTQAQSTGSVGPATNPNAPLTASLAAPGTPPTTAPPLQPLASVDLPRYLGTWYQVALYPNRFQSQCVSDTVATYRALGERQVEVINRCRNASGVMEEAKGLANPRGEINGSLLSPAKLEVSFLPAWLRWMPVGWGNYWVIQLAPDYRYAVVSEPKRDYLWVLSRTAQLSTGDEADIRSSLVSQGFDLSRLQMHRQSPR